MHIICIATFIYESLQTLICDSKTWNYQKSVMEVLNMEDEIQQGIWIIEDNDEFLRIFEDMQQAYLEQKGVGQHDK